MSLATRCPSCGTIFRVVQDQLKISEGWVRCGRCSEVFNALDGLFDLEREAPPPRPAPAAASTPSAAPAPARRPRHEEFVASRVPADEDTPAGAVEIDSFASTVGFRREDSELPPQPPAAHLRAARQAGASQEPPDFADARFPSELPLDSAIDLPEHEHEQDAITLDDPLSRFSFDEVPTRAGFIEAADRQARSERPVWRRVFTALSVLLLLVLSIQVAVHWRNRIALEWPETVPLLEAICDPMACRIEPLQRIESFIVDASALNRAADGSGYRLELTLRNRDHLPLATPSVDLNLTDASGDTLARRALRAGEFQLAVGSATANRTAAPPAVVPPGAELHLQLAFTTPLPRIAGYTVELFYP